MKMIAITATVLCVAATGALAKGHDQGNSDVPGAVPGADNVGSVTVTNAQALGGAGALGGRPADKGPSADNPAVENAGR